MTNYVRKLLTDAEEAGLQITVHCDGEIDYRGFHAAQAEEAVKAVDEAQVRFREGDGLAVGWCLIINGLEPEELIADTSGEWVNAWWQANVGEAAA